ncbi:DEAD/DEAH box helicase [Mycoplasma sp. P36-A1]|uniref:DEAD/DEAH box helicase n=1 Tax=Mycoplasma sp. P36-A1 TaxID=3252900 RepID=UPI003C3034CA
MNRLFNDYNFKTTINKTLEEINFKNPTEIQTKILPILRKHNNVVGISKTGSGKTHAFLLPILDGIDTDINKVQAIIMLPTRELAAQIYENLQVFVKNTENLRVDLMVGGTNLNQEKEITAQIIVGTPGRLLDAITNRNIINSKYVKYMVIDEADMIFDKNFIEESDKVMSLFDDRTSFAIFSATITDDMHPFLKKYFDGVSIIKIDDDPNQNISHILVPSKGKDKFLTLEKIMSDIDPYLCLIFASKKETVEEIANKLLDSGHKVITLHGGLPSRERNKTLKRINNLEFKYVVASDIAARGIDIDGVSHVISYDMPKELEYYIHRSGRTGRHNYTGYSYFIYEGSDEKAIKKLEKKGLKFDYFDFVDGHLVDAGVRNRESKKLTFDNYEKAMVKKIMGRKSDKVKPGYKKKQKRVLEKLRKKQRQDEIKNRIKNQRKMRKRTSDLDD